MGITIAYRGRIDDCSDVDELTDELADFAGDLGWEIRRWNEDWSRPNTAGVTHRDDETQVTGHVPLRGIECFPHPQSEPFPLTFSSEGDLVDVMGMVRRSDEGGPPQDTWNTVKTQFAPIEVHVTLIKLLKYLRKTYISDLEVIDEGNYWETEDVEELRRRRKKLDRGLDQIERGVKQIDSREIGNRSPSEIADRIEEILKKQFGE